MRLVDAETPGAVQVIVTSLEVSEAAEVVSADRPAGAECEVVHDPRPDLSREMYLSVGADWHWVDRRDWPMERWREWVDRPEHHLLLCRVDGTIAGYAELEQQSSGDVEIAYFGLLPGRAGGGLGRWWLACVLAHAWTLPGTQRVWVHTCDLDSPAALPTYVGRGMRPFATQVEWRLPNPETSSGPESSSD